MTTDLCEMPHKTSQASVFDLQKIKPSILQQVGRVHALDGLRGLFALLVFGYHLWDSDRYALRYFNGDGIERFLSLTPFTALTAGWQYVLGFFILSGFALMSPLIKPGRRIRWVAYYCSRIVRLYLPVLVSILLAACLAYYFTHASPGLSYTWLKAVAPYPIGFGNISDALLLGTPDGGYPTLNSPLWSLRWEIIFSLLLPLLAVILVNGLRKLSPIAMLGLLLALAFLMLFLQNALVFYLTIFMLGMLIACYYNALRVAIAAFAKLAGERAFVWLGLCTTVLLFWFSGSREMDFDNQGLNIMAGMQTLSALVGALILIMLSLHGSFQKFLNSKPMQFIGKISFSLYLTHLPVIAALGFVIPRNFWGLHLLISIPVCLLVTTLFWRIFEKPAHDFSKFLKNRIPV